MEKKQLSRQVQVLRNWVLIYMCAQCQASENSKGLLLFSRDSVLFCERLQLEFLATLPSPPPFFLGTNSHMTLAKSQIDLKT